MKLHEVAHSRAGDKGNIANISVIVYRQEDYEMVCQRLTSEVVKRHFQDIAIGKVERFELPQLGALNFVLYDALGGGVTRSLALDQHGKTLSSLMLDIEI